jgi:drug/metabolite transporter (DMT)-like permease
VSSGSASGRVSGKAIIAIVLAVLGVLFVVAAIIFFTVKAQSLPAFMGQITHPYGRAHATRPLHGIAALVAAIVCFVAAFFVQRSNKASQGDESRDPVNASN